MLLNEIFDTKIPVKQWKREGHREVGIIHIDNEEFHIIFEEKHYTFENNILNFINVVFAKVTDGEETQDLTITSKNAAKILGAVFNAVTSKIKKRKDIDAIVFVARDNVEKRMSIYNGMTSNMFNPFTNVIRDVPLPGDGKMTILLKNILDKNIINAFKQYLITLNK